MDLGKLVVSFLVSGTGFVLFSFGRKQQRWPQLVSGLVLMGMPYFVTGILTMLGATFFVLAGLWGALAADW